MSSSSKRDFYYKKFAFLEQIKFHGSVTKALKTCGLKQDTVDDWLQDYPEDGDYPGFRFEYDEALHFHNKVSPIALRNEALEQVRHAIMGTMEVVKNRVATRYDPHGNVIESMETTERVPQGVQKWAIQYALGMANDKYVAIQTLAPYLPRQTVCSLIEAIGKIDTTLVDALSGLSDGQPMITAEKAKPGLSTETVNQIYSRILGTKEDTPGAAKKIMNTLAVPIEDE
jgi:hypothetical protein